MTTRLPRILNQDFINIYNEETFVCDCCKEIIFPRISSPNSTIILTSNKHRVEEDYIFKYCCEECYEP